MKKDLAFDACISRLEFAPIRTWLGEHIHQHGARYTPVKLMQQIGIVLGAEDYLDYIKDKYGTLYEVSL
jgi:carboxypeptidase Taq